MVRYRTGAQRLIAIEATIISARIPSFVSYFSLTQSVNTIFPDAIFISQPLAICFPELLATQGTKFEVAHDSLQERGRHVISTVLWRLRFISLWLHCKLYCHEILGDL